MKDVITGTIYETFLKNSLKDRLTFEEFLNEQPMLNRTVLQHSLDGTTFYSKSMIERNFHFFLKLKNNIVVYQSNDFRLIRGVNTSIQNEFERGYQIVFLIDFRKVPTFNIPNLKNVNLIQSNKIDIMKEYEGTGIISSIYEKLVEEGFAIASDNAQYIGGQKLWQKLARNSKTKNFKIRIWNDAEQDFLKDDKGIIHYDSKNIKESEIWSEDWDFSGSDKILILTRK